MSRWSYADWVLAAVVLDDYGNIYPLSEISKHTSLKVNGYYAEQFWVGSRCYRMDDITGCVYSKYEGSFTIEAHLKITDANGRESILNAECDGYTCCGTDCYMLLIVNPGKDAASTTIEFQEVDEIELKEAVGAKKLENWMHENHGKSTVVEIDGPTF